MARISIKDLPRNKEISKVDYERVADIVLKEPEILKPPLVSKETTIDKLKPNFDPYDEANAVAGIRG